MSFVKIDAMKIMFYSQAYMKVALSDLDKFRYKRYPYQFIECSGFRGKRRMKSRVLRLGVNAFLSIILSKFTV
jgi:hypothetical protein